MARNFGHAAAVKVKAYIYDSISIHFGCMSDSFSLLRVRRFPYPTRRNDALLCSTYIVLLNA